VILPLDVVEPRFEGQYVQLAKFDGMRGLADLDNFGQMASVSSTFTK